MIPNATSAVLQIANQFISRNLGTTRNRCKPPINPMIWKTRRATLDFADRARVMGILNVTPDSFSDGGRHCAPDEALDHARLMIAEGAEIIDIGGESTRPGAAKISADEEMARTVPIISALRVEWDGLISIDTMKASVAAAALAAGAEIVNDVSGLRADAAMAGICAETGCGVVVMHMQGTPRTMQIAPHYDDVVAEVREFFAERLATLTAAGIAADALCFDPGIGFGKTLAHNLALLGALAELPVGGRPLVLGVSRKSFMAKILSGENGGEWPTVALTARARESGVLIHRVHAVRPNLEALRMTEAILNSATPAGD